MTELDDILKGRIDLARGSGNPPLAGGSGGGFLRAFAGGPMVDIVFPTVFSSASPAPAPGWPTDQLAPPSAPAGTKGMFVSVDITALGVGHIMSLRGVGETNPGARQNVFSQVGGLPHGCLICIPTTDGSFEYELTAGAVAQVVIVAWIVDT